MIRSDQFYEVGQSVVYGTQRGKVVKVDGDNVIVQFPPETVIVDRRILLPDLASKHKAAPEMTK